MQEKNNNTKQRNTESWYSVNCFGSTRDKVFLNFPSEEKSTVSREREFQAPAARSPKKFFLALMRLWLMVILNWLPIGSAAKVCKTSSLVLLYGILLQRI